VKCPCIKCGESSVTVNVTDGDLNCTDCGETFAVAEVEEARLGDVCHRVLVFIIHRPRDGRADAALGEVLDVLRDLPGVGGDGDGDHVK
jgi:hypothetical protein